MSRSRIRARSSTSSGRSRSNISVPKLRLCRLWPACRLRRRVTAAAAQREHDHAMSRWHGTQFALEALLADHDGRMVDHGMLPCTGRSVPCQRACRRSIQLTACRVCRCPSTPALEWAIRVNLRRSEPPGQSMRRLPPARPRTASAAGVSCRQSVYRIRPRGNDFSIRLRCTSLIQPSAASRAGVVALERHRSPGLMLLNDGSRRDAITVVPRISAPESS